MDYLEQERKNEEEAFSKHKEIGFPPLSVDQQVQLIYRNDVRMLNNLTPGYRMPYLYPSVVMHYISIDRQVFREKFIELGFIETLDWRSPDSKKDGAFYTKNVDGSVSYKVQERGQVIQGANYSTYESFINSIVEAYCRNFGI